MERGTARPRDEGKEGVKEMKERKGTDKERTSKISVVQ